MNPYEFHNSHKITENSFIKNMPGTQEFKKEILANQILQASGIPVAKIKSKSKEKKTIEFRLIDSDETNKNNFLERFRKICTTYKQIHSIPYIENSLLEDKKFDRNQLGEGMLEHFHQKYFPKLDELGYNPKKLSEFLSECKPQSANMCYIHGDAKARHFLFKGQRLNAIIDFEFFSYFDPRLDLGTLLVETHLKQPELFDESYKVLKQGYGNIFQREHLMFYMACSKMIQAVNIDSVYRSSDSLNQSIKILDKIMQKREVLLR